jgi:hypothetical protein
MKPKSEMILYQTEDGRTRLEVRLENETVWLTQKLIGGACFKRMCEPSTNTSKTSSKRANCRREFSYPEFPDNCRRWQNLRHAALQPRRDLGLTSWPGAKVRKPDVAIAKNYLTENELKKLGLIVTQYLDFAELQALERRLMTMRDWIAKLDAFLRAGDRKILEHAGGITAGEAKQKAKLEFDRFEARRRQLEDARAEAGFEQEVEDLAKATKQLKPAKRKK